MLTVSSSGQSRATQGVGLSSLEVEIRSRLTNRIGFEEASKYVERFGETAEDSYEIENAIKLIAARRAGEVDYGYLNTAMDRIANRGIDKLSERQRSQLASSWFLGYDVTRRLDGNTPEA